MKYVIDSSSLIKVFDHDQHLYPTFWKKFNDYMKSNRLVSVREARREIENGGDSLSKWASSNKTFFPEPNEEELNFVSEIFENRHYQKLVKTKYMLSGGPVADPFLIAKTKALGGYLITEDGFFKSGKLKENNPSPAWICHNFEIGCVNLNNFMKREGWEF